MSAGARPAGPILIVEDDPNILELVRHYLTAAGFETVTARDGGRGLELARQRKPVLVVLDVMLPVLDGWDVCRELRKTSDVPIVMLTAREEEADRIVGFSLGADDYVVKPFSPRELVERVKAILRRAGLSRARPEKVLVHGPLTLDPQRHRVTLADDEVILTPTEFKLLQALMSRPGMVFNRSELLSRLYERGEVVVDRVIDVHIGKLRRKIEADPAKPQFIETVHGLGYRFADPIANPGGPSARGRTP